MKFMPYTGDLMGLPTDENHINFLWCEPGCKVLFSVTRQGNAASCHFASDKNGMKKINNGIKEFCKFIFYIFPWCKFIFAKTEVQKVKPIISDIGFVEIFKKNKKLSAYALKRGVL